MNAVMPGPSPQLPPYGSGLNPNEGDPLPPNTSAHFSNSNNDDTDTSPSNSNAIDTNTTNNNKPIGGPNHQRHSSSSTTSSPPQPPVEYSSQQHQSEQRQHQHQQMGVSFPRAAGPGSFGAGVGAGAGPITFDPTFNPVSTNPSSYPWTIGSTDGSFALVNLKQQHIQQQQQQQRRQSLSDNINNSAIPENMPAGPDGTATGGVGVGVGVGATTTGSGEDGVTIPTQQQQQQQSQPHSQTVAQAAIANTAAVIQAGRSLYHDKLFHQSSSSVEAILSASCEVMGFDIAEMWLRTGLKTHQLTNSHLRPTALQDSVRQELVEVYYGDKSNERTHRLSPALCKRAKDANDVVWVTAHTQTGAEALRMSISNVRTAVAVPVCHEASNTNVTIIYFSIRRIVLRPSAVEFLIHVSLSAAVTSVNALDRDGLVIDKVGAVSGDWNDGTGVGGVGGGGGDGVVDTNNQQLSKTTGGTRSTRSEHGVRKVFNNNYRPTQSISYQRADRTSITGARLDLQWRQLLNVEYLTDGGNSWIHTAVFDGKPVVVKTLRPECQDTALAINEIEAEVAVHSRLNHQNVVSLIGAGWTSKKVRFIVLERLDGGTLTQMLGYDTRIRDRRRRFWRKKSLPYLDVLRCARSLACALQYCNERAIPGSIVLHRDLKPDNIGFTLDGKVKLLDFGLARILENSDPESNEVYEMSGETGSLRYMAPEVAEGLSYNHKADVYSFGVILWEMNAGKRPFHGLSRDTFYEQVVHGGGRPTLNKKWPSELNKLISDCWSVDIEVRPTFGQIVDTIDNLLTNEKGGKTKGKSLKRLTGIIDRHSTWF